MAQFYQVIGQGDQAIQAVTLEELRQYYPNICVESSGVQYVLQDEVPQYQSQQVIRSSDQQIVLNSSDGMRQVIVDQSQMNYATTPNKIVEYQQPQQVTIQPQQIAIQQPQQVAIQPPQQVAIQQSSQVSVQQPQQNLVQQTQVPVQQGQVAVQQAQVVQQPQQIVQQPQQVAVAQQVAIQQPQQVFYAAGSNTKPMEQAQQIIRPQQVQFVNHIIQDQRQIMNHQIIAPNQRVITQHVITEPVGHMMPQQINNPSVIQQRRVSVQTTPPRQATPQQLFQTQQQIPEQNDSENQLVQTSDGRVMTLGQLKEELATNRRNETASQVQESVNKDSSKKGGKGGGRNRGSNARGRGGGNRGRGRGGANSINRAQHINEMSPIKQVEVNQQTPPKQFQNVQQNSPQKTLIHYGNKTSQFQQNETQNNQIPIQQNQNPQQNQQILQQRNQVIQQVNSPNNQQQSNQLPQNSIVPNQVVQNQSAPNRVIQNQIRPNQGTPNRIMQSQVAPNRIVQNQPAPNRVVQNQIAPNRVIQSQIAPNQTIHNRGQVPQNRVVTKQVQAEGESEQVIQTRLLQQQLQEKLQQQIQQVQQNTGNQRMMSPQRMGTPRMSQSARMPQTPRMQNQRMTPPNQRMGIPRLAQPRMQSPRMGQPNLNLPQNNTQMINQRMMSPQLQMTPQQTQANQMQQIVQQQQQRLAQQFQQQTQQPRRQPPIPLVPVSKMKPKKPGGSPNQNLDDNSSSVSDEYKDSAKMWVCLENGEQRIITFTLPKESCTVQDLLEQVGVPFDANTNIRCNRSNGDGDIDYFVYVGNCPTQAYVASQEVLTVDNLKETQECIVSQTGAVIPVNESSKPSQPEPEQPKSPEKPEPPKEVVKMVPGYLALCPHCGFLSDDFNRCQRCRTKMPEEPKAVPASKQIQEKKDANKTAGIKLGTLATVGKLNPKVVATKPGPASLKLGRKPKKINEEPVVLTLSSDDEEETPTKAPQTVNSFVNRISDNIIAQSVLDKEPKYIGGYPTLTEDDYQLTGDDENSVVLPCRTIRIGTHKFVPREDVKIMDSGILITAPLPNDPTKCVTINIPTKSILKLLVNFHKALPVLFYYLVPSAGEHIRSKLQMTQGSDIYYDPISRQDPYKRITLLPDVIDEAIKSDILKIYSKMYDNRLCTLTELDTREANEILIRSCPKDQKKEVLPNSTTPSPQNKLPSNSTQLLIYPPPPAKGGITINLEDYLCLAQDQFLNDAIIDFYLKYIQLECIDKSIHDKVHIFSSFFYKRLTTKPVKASKRLNPFEIDPNLTPAQKRHCRVKKWTKNVNIFEKDFVIIPINENSHWFLAIICFPGLEECVSYGDNKIVKLPPKEKRKKHCKVAKTSTSLVIGNTTITLETKKSTVTKVNNELDEPIKCDDAELSDRDEAEGDESEFEDSDETESEEATTEKQKKTKEAIKQPCILIFDSLSGPSRSRVVATLRDYLTCEHRAKLNSTKTFTKDNIKGACPKVPQQMNFTDCGLYVLQYVESFFSKPITDYHIPIKELENWFEEIEVTKKREDISLLIKKLMCDMKRKTSFIPELTFPTLNGKLVNTNSSPPEDELEHETDGDEMETEQISTTQASLVSESYNSEDGSDDSKKNEQLNKSENSSGSGSSCVVKLDPKTLLIANINSFMNKQKDRNNDSDVQKKSNRETMSYLKSKRIIRHKNNDSFESKKQKLE